jgi:hypothetical protein
MRLKTGDGRGMADSGMSAHDDSFPAIRTLRHTAVCQSYSCSMDGATYWEKRHSMAHRGWWAGTSSGRECGRRDSLSGPGSLSEAWPPGSSSLG